MVLSCRQVLLLVLGLWQGVGLCLGRCISGRLGGTNRDKCCETRHDGEGSRSSSSSSSSSNDGPGNG